MPGQPAAAPPPTLDPRLGVATWALQFSPRVALREEAVLMEVEASVRLFGGRRALRDRVVQEGAELGVAAVAWAPNSLAAQALARAGVENGFKRPLEALLDGLPMAVLSAVQPHHETLARLGCRLLGDVRRLPRGGLGRRFDAALLTALDQAYGLRPEAHEWLALPETFHGRLELMSRVEMAPALLFGARRLLLQLCGWLAARHAGVTAFSLHWVHDSMRARDVGPGGQLAIRTAEPTRALEHLCRLLAEHLARLQLPAPVGELRLQADEVHPLEEATASLLPDDDARREVLPLVLERLAARLGPERVLRPVLTADHRLEWMQMWQPAPATRATSARRSAAAVGAAAQAAASLPQPTWVLPQPVRLATRGHRPLYQGLLQLLSGPHRVEGGWWHRLAPSAVAAPIVHPGAHAHPLTTDPAPATAHLQRDYWLAVSEHAGLLWIYQERLASDETAWYLHGVFA
ncbi:DNA polymerase Y family protein [Ideonella sp. TBM-1]|uniref:DNA polymerase Y family protein n=1 Tax=Ideonella livida TaxID=2707176 RepID=A0A7C9PKY2_9BURK|nr:DNA polymerase Y family protein [Ideonella livida]